MGNGGSGHVGQQWILLSMPPAHRGAHVTLYVGEIW